MNERWLRTRGRRLGRNVVGGALLAGLSMALCGCQQLGSLIIALSPEQTKTIKAEYPFLEGKKVLILVWAGDEVRAEFLYLNLNLSRVVRAALEAHLKGVQVVPARPVAEMQDRELDWDRKHPVEHAQRFRADIAILIELTAYRIHEPDSPQLLRGEIAANVRVYDASYGVDAGPVWDTRDKPIHVFCPENGPAGFDVRPEDVQVGVMRLFAEELAGKFYDRKVAGH
jgi:hypothetical protein